MRRTSPTSSRWTRPGRALCGLAASVLWFSLAAPAAAASAEEHSGAPLRPRPDKVDASGLREGAAYDRFIVKYADPAQAADKAREAGERAGLRLRADRTLATRASLVRSASTVGADEARDVMAELAADPSVAYVEPDVLLTPVATPNDTRYPEQWHYAEAVAGMNLPGAWNTADGAGVVVAVIDTGITAHPDLDANVVAGYDFISDAAAARDGNGRDANAADQGDWYAANECGQPTGARSSWHGTHVAGTVAAVSNNGTGVAGVAFRAKVQPVRVLGKCGGYLSDITDGVIWASGGTVTGVPANATPAKVINMSLGGSGACGTTYQNAINAAVGRGTTVVVAAGNSNADASGFRPASCANVINVAALDRQGNRSYYSNYGASVDVAAPGGETNAGASNGVLSTLNAGTTTPGAASYAFYQGTSMATPHVAGLAALVLGERALSPAQVESTLKANVRPVPGSCSGGCGAGLVDAARTIAALGGGEVQPSSFENAQDYSIPDGGTAQSPLAVSRSGNAPSTLRVSVDIKHTYRGDLVLDLLAPDGSAYRLKNASSSDGADNVIATYTVNASSEAASGTWRLRVQDIYRGDTGYIDRWALQF